MSKFEFQLNLGVLAALYIAAYNVGAQTGNRTEIRVDAAGTYVSPTFPNGTYIRPVWNTVSVF